MKRKTMIYAFLAIGVIVAGVYGWKLTARSSYESAAYEVIESDGKFEIRQYPDLMTVSTEMQDSQGKDGSFMRLFRYIDGKNEDNQKIAMTTPVFMKKKANGIGGEMTFVLPKNVSPGEIPEPADDSLRIQNRNAGKFAVFQFSGRMNTESVAAATRKLQDWMKSKGLDLVGQVVTAGYDPPWTPGPFRRNEILIRLR